MVREYTHQDKLWADKVKAVQLQAEGYNSCVVCGAVENLQADHIKSYRDNPELRYDVDNGTVLCAHHNKTKGTKAPTLRMQYINSKYLDVKVLRA